MAEYSLTITANKTIEKLTFAGKEYINTWVTTSSGSKTFEKSIADQIQDDYPDFDNEDLLDDIDNVSTMYILEVRDLMERLGDYEKNIKRT